MMPTRSRYNLKRRTIMNKAKTKFKSKINFGTKTKSQAKPKTK